MTHEFKRISSFEEILQIAESRVKSSEVGYEINLAVPVEFNIELVRKPQLLDVSAKAEEWQSVERPPNLEFNHGEFIGADGVTHVVHELKHKHSGNRALISLISQEHIINSGDNPIPSFLIFQCSIEQKCLHCTVYFRALEVSRFFRINVEEIRQIASHIYDEFRGLDSVRLLIFAFRAYSNPQINTLERARLDNLDEISVLKIMEKRPSELPDLLREKARHVTVVNTQTLKTMRDILDDSDKSQDVDSYLKKPRIALQLQQCVDVGNALADLRVRVSHHKDVDTLTQDYVSNLTGSSHKRVHRLG
jgi:hypothetical protein